MTTRVYSFMNVQAAISGAGGAFNLGYGAANAEEGISVSFTDDKGISSVGADGSIMATLRATVRGKMTIRYLKTAPVNGLLSQLYNAQSTNPAFWATNTLTLADIIRGDQATLSGAWFDKEPDVNWAQDGGMQEWVFTGSLFLLLGQGSPILDR